MRKLGRLLRKKSCSQPQVNATVQNLRGESPPSRNSVHSSGSSSLGSSLERLDESGYASQVNIHEMISNGAPEHEVLAAWLGEMRFDEYIPMFLGAGYDLATVARMTPEDLTAIGISKPGHRKRLTAEIHRLNIADPWPSSDPPGGLREWLAILNMADFIPVFEAQGYTTIGQVMQLTWEDYEDFGVTKLGHLKKLDSAVKKLKDGRTARLANAGGDGVVQAGGEVLVINVPAPVVQRQGSSSSGASGDVLHDIGHMLQNLTDELEALLHDRVPS